MSSERQIVHMDLDSFFLIQGKITEEFGFPILEVHRCERVPIVSKETAM